MALAPEGAAETVTDAFHGAVAGSAELAVRRARLKAQRQDVPIALSEALPQIQFSATAGRVFRDDPAFRQVGSQKREEWRGAATGSQLLFGSGRVWSNYRQARLQVESSEALYEEAFHTLLFDTVRVYADVRRARAVVSAVAQTLANLEQQREYVAANQRAGFLTMTDLAQAEARIAAGRSQSARAAADLIAAQRGYERIVGHLPGDLDAPAGAAQLPQSEEVALEQASRQRKILEAARQAVRAASAGIDAAHAVGRPRLSLEATSAIENDFEGIATDRSIDDQVGLRLTIPFSAGGANWARVRQQRALRDAARQEATIALRDLEQSVAVAWAELVAARVAVISSGEEVRAAELALRGVRREQQNGLRAVIDVLDQEQGLLLAQLALARAERDATAAAHRLLFEVGGLDCESCRWRPRVRRSGLAAARANACAR